MKQKLLIAALMLCSITSKGQATINIDSLAHYIEMCHYYHKALRVCNEISDDLKISVNSSLADLAIMVECILEAQRCINASQMYLDKYKWHVQACINSIEKMNIPADRKKTIIAGIKQSYL